MNMQAMKQSLRQSIIAARSAIAPAERLRLDNLIAARIAQLEVYHTAVTILGYMNFGAEFIPPVSISHPPPARSVLLPGYRSPGQEPIR